MPQSSQKLKYRYLAQKRGRRFGIPWQTLDSKLQMYHLSHITIGSFISI
uniref:Uncharacterized protein n=1 Tax=Rhizophora mucronata TaxID=61149 RepID=A0A2P2Q6K4_RHIMU